MFWRLNWFDYYKSLMIYEIIGTPPWQTKCPLKSTNGTCLFLFDCIFFFQTLIGNEDITEMKVGTFLPGYLELNFSTYESIGYYCPKV